MTPLHSPIIPDSYLNFAKACAALAASHGIQTFKLQITPKFGECQTENSSVTGDVQINYTQIDGRSRPSENLTVYMTTNTRVAVIKNPESYS